MAYNVAVVGATGNVGREILNILAERQFPVDKVYALASSSSVGAEVSFGDDDTIKCDALDTFDFSKVDVVLSSVDTKTTKQFAPKATAAGAYVIDNSSAFRMEPNVPLIVPEVNAHRLKNANKRHIIASPNCVATPLACVLKPLSELAKIRRVVVSTYQSTAGAGRKAMDELFAQTRAIFMNNPVTKAEFTKQIAFNVIPHIDNFMANGQTGEEEKIASETKKILESDAKFFATSVRVPTFVCHGISVNIEFDGPVSDKQAQSALNAHEHISVVDHRVDEGYVTPVEAAHEDNVFVSRIRQDTSVEHGLALWVVSDNLRKGAALNTVQIAESLAQNGYLKKS